MIAALFVETNGVYFGLDEIDPWDVRSDARDYFGPYPVIAHPPCQRWGRYWSGGPMLAKTPQAKFMGDDNGCFYSALRSVRLFGGVLEHPEASHAWKFFGLARPPKSGGWIPADTYGGWTCCVEQGNYGHPARKATWLYANLAPLPELKWGMAPGKTRIEQGCHDKAERARLVRQGICQRISKKARLATPIPFRDLLIDMVQHGT